MRSRGRIPGRGQRGLAFWVAHSFSTPCGSMTNEILKPKLIQMESMEKNFPKISRLLALKSYALGATWKLKIIWLEGAGRIRWTDHKMGLQCFSKEEKKEIFYQLLSARSKNDDPMSAPICLKPTYSISDLKILFKPSNQNHMILKILGLVTSHVSIFGVLKIENQIILFKSFKRIIEKIYSFQSSQNLVMISNYLFVNAVENRAYNLNTNSGLTFDLRLFTWDQFINQLKESRLIAFPSNKNHL